MLHLENNENQKNIYEYAQTQIIPYLTDIA